MEMIHSVNLLVQCLGKNFPVVLQKDAEKEYPLVHSKEERMIVEMVLLIDRQ